MTRQLPVHDGEVIAQSLTDVDVFEVIFDRHFDAIHRYVARRAGAHAGDTVASDTFCVAFDRRDRFDVHRADARPWLFGIATNLLRRHWRSEGRRRRAETRLHGERVTTPQPTEPHDRIDAALLDDRLRAALDQLRGGDRDVLLLFAWGGLSYAEIADALGILVGTVQSRLNRSRRRIRSRLGAAAAASEADAVTEARRRTIG
jgi:RNA polymerase sigma-70 factor (ECF subfamily)